MTWTRRTGPPVERKAVERLQHHAAAVARATVGLEDAAAATASRTSALTLAVALNGEEARYRVTDRAVQCRDPQGGWDGGHPVSVEFSDEAQAVVPDVIALQAACGQAGIGVALLALACCERPAVARLRGLGLPVTALARELRRGLATDAPAQAVPPAEAQFTPAAKAVLMDGSTALGAAEGGWPAGPEHILLAALDRPDPVLSAAAAALHIDVGRARAALRGGVADERERAALADLAGPEEQG